MFLKLQVIASYWPPFTRTVISEVSDTLQLAGLIVCSMKPVVAEDRHVILQVLAGIPKS